MLVASKFSAKSGVAAALEYAADALSFPCCTCTVLLPMACNDVSEALSDTGLMKAPNLIAKAWHEGARSL